jgi:GNAT superfamily N-acetyltransferase
VPEARLATLDDRALLARVAAAAFYDDPVMSWVFQDPADRLAKLEDIFGGVVDDFFPDRGVVQVVDDASVAFWRGPDFDHHPQPSEATGDPPPAGSPPAEVVNPYTDEELERLVVLGAAMDASHPHEVHWYLNVVGTAPDRQGRGLGAVVLQPVLDRCDADGHRAYLESTNPRNRSLYRRHGFIEADEIPVGDGPPMVQMWRDPRA